MTFAMILTVHLRPPVRTVVVDTRVRHRNVGVVVVRICKE